MVDRDDRDDGEPTPPGGGADDLLRELGALAAEQEREGARSPWERMVRGDLTPEEIAELERLAGESSEANALLAAARPLDARAQERIVAALEARVGAVGATPVLRPARWRSRVAVGAGALALAAGLVVFVRTSGSEDLPRYALDSSGASSSRAPTAPGPSPGPMGTRGPACVLRASTTGSFELLARPDDAVSGAVGARAFLVRGGEPSPWPGELEISQQGSIRVSDLNQKLAGASELRIVVGRTKHLEPNAARELARGVAVSGHGWQVLRCTILDELP